MKITEVRIFPTESRDGKLKAFATMTFDDWFVVRNVKIIQGTSGLFVAMPSRKAMDSCPKCRTKNARGSKYCNECGQQLPAPKPDADHGKKQGSHMDVAHPISQQCRVYLQDEILKAYEAESGSNEPERGAPQPEEKENEAQEEAPKEETKIDEPKEEPAPSEEEPKSEAAPEEERKSEAPTVEGDKDIEL